MPELDTFAGVSKRMKISNGESKSIELNARSARLINKPSPEPGSTDVANKKKQKQVKNQQYTFIEIDKQMFSH